MRRRQPSPSMPAAATSRSAPSSKRKASLTRRWRRHLPELRIDPLSGLRAIVAGERAARPGAFSSKIDERPPIDREKDPFAEGHEDQTPPEVWALRPGGGGADTPGWKIRVVPNLYPALGAGD